MHIRSVCERFRFLPLIVIVQTHSASFAAVFSADAALFDDHVLPRFCILPLSTLYGSLQRRTLISKTKPLHSQITKDILQKRSRHAPRDTSPPQLSRDESPSHIPTTLSRNYNPLKAAWGCSRTNLFKSTPLPLVASRIPTQLSLDAFASNFPSTHPHQTLSTRIPT